jgi:hypothetical protein
MFFDFFINNVAVTVEATAMKMISCISKPLFACGSEDEGTGVDGVAVSDNEGVGETVSEGGGVELVGVGLIVGLGVGAGVLVCVEAQLAVANFGLSITMAFDGDAVPVASPLHPVKENWDTTVGLTVA